MANLRPPFRAGVQNNPNPANNGHSKRAQVVAFLDEPFDKNAEESRTRFQAMLLAAFEHVIGGEKGWDAAFRALMEQYAGRPRASHEEFSLSVAEHLRRIALDQFGVLIRALGDRLKTMSPEEFGRFAKMCDGDVTRYLRAAEAELSGAPPPIDAPAAPQIQPPPAPESSDPDPKGVEPANDDGKGGANSEPTEFETAPAATALDEDDGE